MTASELQALIDSITYKPGYKLERIGRDLRWRLVDVPDAYRKYKYVTVVNQWFTIPWGVTREDAIRMIFAMLAYHEDHEMREFFKVDGKSPYNPHRKGCEVTIDHHIGAPVTISYNGDDLNNDY